MKKLFALVLLFAPLSMMAQKFGHINSQEILNSMPEYATARTEVETLQKQFEQDLQGMQAELQKKAEAFEKEEKDLPEKIKERRVKELQDLDARIKQSYQDNSQTLQETSAKKMQEITAKITEAIKAVGMEGGYVYIMDVTGGVPYISTTLSTDVTAQVKEKLKIK